LSALRHYGKLIRMQSEKFLRRGGALLLLATLMAAPALASDTPFKVVASPHGYVAQCSVDAAEALRRLNAARASGRSCGGHRMPAAPLLQWDPSLQSVATAHSRDMARRNYFGHRSPEGRTVRDRVAGTPFKTKMVGENLAGGDRQVGGAIQGWLESPAHCENLMNPKFSQVAVACVGKKGSQWGTYWTMVLGRH
jgi:uncharacterized protein YkwD